MRTYNRVYQNGVIGRSGEEIVEDFLCHQRGSYSSAVGIEEKINRLAFLIGRVADHAGINLLEIIEPCELSGTYERCTDSE